jgi:hypothetical protein
LTGKQAVVATWISSRLLLAVVAASVIFGQDKSLADVLGNWDVRHFESIAENGYVAENDVAFFPGWPLLLRLVSLSGLPIIATGALLAAGCSALAAAALYRLGGPGAAIAWLLAPTGVFTVVAYSESVFCAAAFWAWERARAGRWGPAAALTAVACSVRVSGLFLIGALAILALTQHGDWPTRLLRLPYLLTPAIVVAGYGCYLQLTRGSWMAWFTAQAAGWYRELTWPWVSLQHTWEAVQPGAYADNPEWVWVFRAELVSMVIGLICTLVCLLRKRWAEGSWVGVQVLAFSTSYWFMSVNRAVLLWFPLWTGIGQLAKTRSTPGRTMLAAAGVFALGVQVVWGWLFFTGRWAS